MTIFISNLIYSFLISFGVIIGAALFAGVAAVINNHPPVKTMFDVASSIKIWAVVVALGGTFSSFEIIEQGLFKGEIKSVIKQMGYIIFAFVGANLGYNFIKLIRWCSQIWMS
ncbi:Sporulation protein YtrH [Alkalithermobacter thermoalcaliphilus JW-YL-7 = DSM 7308]|uniref:Sporulation protein YtrH n=1 Tax=Alkalithermobacter thermoalcaliphilus JW-YL-7 = DSM 7308 TaxID=1121328 RepID=A0A150FQP3_CLOPD|nr:Sporulation protein YtrH [[Clostridium] paradoxum JW-YL-7 = DSM 7308]SHK77851.1 Sporulation protein YtrH [[Clostridium] paradoxum JW-YL-7 = DSM 7308]